MRAVHKISENVISNSNKPIKFVHLQKLTSQSILNDAHVIEMSKTLTKYLVVR